MHVPSKPSRIGLWIYQLVAQLENGLPILIHMTMMAAETPRGERAPVHDVIRNCRDVVVHFSHQCILVFDSYYFSANSVAVLEEPLDNDRPSREMCLTRGFRLILSTPIVLILALIVYYWLMKFMPLQLL